MFYFLSKLFAFLEKPITWVFILVLLAILDKKITRKKKWLIASAIVLYFFSNATVFDLVMSGWESKPTTISKKYDVGIVLSGVIQFNVKYDRLQFMRRSDRIMKAVDLYKQGLIGKIILAGGNGSMENGVMHENQRLIPLLEQYGVKREDLIVEGASGNTIENAKLCKQILDREFTGHSCLLFTSAYHMPRAIRCFRKAGIQSDPYPCDLYSGKFKIGVEKLFLPNAETLFNWETLTHEWLGFIGYRIAGYI